MSEHCDCKKNAIVRQLLEVEAQVTVTPLIKHGDPRVYCIDSEVQPDCCSKKKNKPPGSGKCCFTVKQVICVEIPITFGVEVDVDEGIVCGPPEVGPCCVDLRTPSLPEPHEPERPKEPPQSPTE